MKKQTGFTLVELMTVIAIVVILLSIVAGGILNNRGWTEERALNGANIFLDRNGINAKRLTCAGDSDGDGYGTCNVVTLEGEKIILNCPTNFFDTKIWGATECKEVFQNYNINFGQNKY